MRLIFQGGRTFYVYICFYAVATCPSISSHINKRDTVQFSHLQTYFQNNDPLHYPIETLIISLHFTSVHYLHFLFYYHYYFVFLLALQPPLGVVFYSPLAGFSLLACEVS